MLEDEIVVSVIVPTYNHVRYISQALDGILMQDAPFRFEVLVGDDASTDGTSDIVREYAHRHPDVIKAFIRPKNLGATRNAYELLMAARGTYLATCEGDDYWTDRHKLAIQVEYLQDHPEMCGCVHDCVVVDEQGRPRRNQKIEWVRKKRVFTLADCKGIYLPGQLATFVRRNIFADQTRDFRIIYQADPMIGDRTSIMLYLQEGDCFRIDRKMSCYRTYSVPDSYSATSVCYARNQCRVQVDYRILNAMENYSKANLPRQIDFEHMRRRIFADAIIQGVRGTGNADFTIAREIWEEHGKIEYLLAVPIRFVQKASRRIVNRFLADRGSGITRSTVFGEKEQC